jgi:hypothetical protein
MESNCAIKVLVVFAIIIFALWFMFPRTVRMADYFDIGGLGTENFDMTGTEFVGIGEPKYDMRGEPVKKSCILNTYMKPERNIRLNLYGSEITSSDYSPIEEGKSNCRKVECPQGPVGVDGYDNNDTCWTCGSLKHDVMNIPDIHPHVMN